MQSIAIAKASSMAVVGHFQQNPKEELQGNNQQ
jgi:hypothetical protein